MGKEKTTLDYYLEGKDGELNQMLLVRLIQPHLCGNYKQSTELCSEIFDGAQLMKVYVEKWKDRDAEDESGKLHFSNLSEQATYIFNSGIIALSYPLNVNSVGAVERVPNLYIAVAYAWMYAHPEKYSALFRLDLKDAAQEAAMLQNSSADRLISLGKIIVDDWREGQPHADAILETQQEQQDVEDVERGVFTSRQLIFLFQTIFDLTFDSKTNIYAFSNFIARVSGKKPDTIRGYLKTEAAREKLSFDRLECQTDIQLLSDELKKISLPMADKILRNIQ